MNDLFERPRRAARRVMMHAVDAGAFPSGRPAAHHKCSKCGHDNGWTETPANRTALLRGKPCPRCNGADI